MAKNENPGVTAERNAFLIQPSDPAQKAITEKVELACRNRLITDFRLRLNAGYLTTIACVYTETLVRTLVELMRQKVDDPAINFLDIFTISSNNRENDEADKDGNINVKFVPGPVIESIMERDFVPDLTPDMWHGTILEDVQKECNKVLSTKHKMASGNSDIWTIITFVYLEYLFRTLKLMARAAVENEKSAVSLNFLELFEAHAIIEVVAMPENPEITSEHITVKLRPGFQAKLLIKDDGVTEIMDDE